MKTKISNYECKGADVAMDDILGCFKNCACISSLLGMFLEFGQIKNIQLKIYTLI